MKLGFGSLAQPGYFVDQVSQGASMRKMGIIGMLLLELGACTMSTESVVHSYNGKTVEMELYGDAFAFGSAEQQQAQIEAARAKAAEVCGGQAKFLSRRMDAQPQNGIFYVESRHIALFQCV